MFTDTRSTLYRYRAQIRAAANLLKKSDINDNIVDRLGIYLKIDTSPQSEFTPHIRHIINMLYTIRVETGFTGQDFVDIVLCSIIHTLKTKTMSEIEEDICFLLADVFVEQHNLYKHQR